MERNKANEIAQQLFKSYPAVNVFHITEDGQAFEIEENAKLHARHLNAKNPEVITVKREDQPVEVKPKGSKVAKDESANKDGDPEDGNNGATGEDDESAGDPEIAQ